MWRRTIGFVVVFVVVSLVSAWAQELNLPPKDDPVRTELENRILDLADECEQAGYSDLAQSLTDAVLGPVVPDAETQGHVCKWICLQHKRHWCCQSHYYPYNWACQYYYPYPQSC